MTNTTLLEERQSFLTSRNKLSFVSDSNCDTNTCKSLFSRLLFLEEGHKVEAFSAKSKED